MRRARLRRLQMQKQAAIVAVSPAISRLASRAQPQIKEKNNVALSANSSKRKAARKVNASNPVKFSEKKKSLRK
ncbi:uncharacterized protein PITG_22714 [Phytophthora infestans T30-4]|uniref:Uncharacterized protein n=2 Tax=Phytophthora infestans TaxID=4787 RepID=D0MZL7_PHYIT|nr:uncharacterized protein PITG_22714 [Phytophthora infestans T30-4]EEY65680.1 conserved hypothetical protein [Phytophthora infestans T30-4]|eukprot:XP_002906279.1 conserved hypothetical protein [Phytophthora infestans T30-4]